MKSFHYIIFYFVLNSLFIKGINAQVFDYVNSGLSNPVGFTIDNGTMYIGSVGAAKIQTVDMSDPNLIPQDFVNNINFPTDFIVIGDELYFTHGFSNVGKIDLNASTPSVANVLTGLDNAFGLAVKNNHIYVGLRNTGEIIRFDYTLGINPPIETIATGLGSFINQILIDIDYLYIARGSDQKISRIDLSQSGFPIEDIVTINSEDDGGVIGIGINNDILYYSSNYLRTIDLNNLNNPPVTYFSGASSAYWEILFDNNEIYISQQTANRIVRFEDNFIDPTTSQDYNVLVNFYNSNNGTNWENDTHWLDTTQSLYSWHGVATENNRVIGLNSINNNVSGTLQSDFGNLDLLRNLSITGSGLTGLPTEITNLNNLETIQLSNNELSGVLPDFSNLPQLETLNIQNNNYLFGDLEPNFQSNINITNFFYTSQSKISDDVTQYVTIGQNITLDATTTGSNNQYQWFFNDQTLANETSPVLTLSNVQQSQLGEYRCEITNSLVTGLTLETGITSFLLDPTNSPDYNALVALYNSTSGANWTNNTNWLDTTKALSDWHGVTTQFINGEIRVTDIILESNNMDGSIPPEIGDLTFLQTLNLQVNNITGEIPSEIGNLNNLTFLRLNTNAISGDFPIAITTLSQLQYLSLSVNQFTGSLPAEIGNMSSLQQLYYGGTWNNPITPGTIPPEIGNLSNLIVLDLRSSNLIGNIPPEIGNLTNLQILFLMFNNLEGNIPSSIGDIPFLYQFDVQLNNLSGDIPYFSFIGSSNISGSYLNIADNNFQFGDFETEHNIYLNNTDVNYIFNPQNTLPSPDDILAGVGESVSVNANVSGTQNNYTWFKLNEDGSKTNVDFDSTLDFTINSSLDYGVYGFDVTSNLVSGLTISSDTFSIEDLPTNSPDYNALVALYNSTNGNDWVVNDNWLDTTKALSTWTGISTDPATNRVTSIALSNNNITGTLPPEIGDFTALKSLAFQSNLLSGEIPLEFWNLVNLEQIYLNSNFTDLTFTSTTNPTFSNLPNLVDVFLSDIDLPQQAITELSTLSNLNILFLVRCGLGPDLPASWASITNFALQLSGNNFSGSIPSSFQNSNISFVDLSRNLFDFSDLEPLANNNSISNLIYSPQRTQDNPLNIQEPPGSDITLNINDTGINSENLISEAANNNYQWFKDENIINGATTNLYTIFNAQEEDSGIYTCEITNDILPDLIIERAPITVEVDETFSVDDYKLGDIFLYPNPTQNLVYIGNSSLINIEKVLIHNTLGKIVLIKNKFDYEQISIDLSELASGMYLIQINTADDQRFTKRILKN